MENCIANARVLKEGIEKTGRFDIVSKDVGVPLVAFSLKDSSKYTVFQIAENL
jgi:glutamate decarboxylase